MKRYIAAALCIGLVCGLVAPVGAQTVSDQVQWLFDRYPAESMQALQAGAATIQAELDARGSSMNAQQVLLGELKDVRDVQLLLQARQQLLANGVSESSGTIQGLDTDLAALGYVAPAE